MRPVKSWINIVLLIALLLGSEIVYAGEYYVSSNGLDTNSGTEDSPWSLHKANSAAQPGDILVLKGGTYRTWIRPAVSGSKGNPIIYKAGPGEKPLFTELPYRDSRGIEIERIAVNVKNRSYITIDGITAIQVQHFIVAEKTSHLTVQNCHFDTTRAFAACKLRQMGDHCVFRENFFSNGGDSLTLAGGDFHLIENNTFDTARHETLTLMGVQRSVVRHNRLTNPIQKTMSILTTRRSEYPDPQRRTMYCVIENNIFGPSTHNIPEYPGSWGIQYAANKTILRRNIFWKSGGGWNSCGYGTGNGRDDPEAMHNRSNRFYNNVIYKCGEVGRYASGPGIGFGSGVEDWGDQVVLNNIIFGNRKYPDGHYHQDGPRNVQISIAPNIMTEIRFLFNNIMGPKAGYLVFKVGKEREKEFTLSGYEAVYPLNAYGNIEADPQFVDPENGDFRLKEGSPCIDRGGPLTLTRSAGQGRDIEVDDALYFCDGYGIIEPDVIRLGDHRVTIERVNYDSNTITVSKDISWEKETLVFLDYKGDAPDIGAFEFGEKE